LCGFLVEYTKTPVPSLIADAIEIHARKSAAAGLRQSSGGPGPAFSGGLH
jgi:hypothetical protein